MSIEPELANRQIQVQVEIFVALKVFDKIPTDFLKMRFPSWSFEILQWLFNKHLIASTFLSIRKHT